MPKLNAGQLQRVHLRLGDVVLDPAIWPKIMDELSRAVGAAGAGLLQSDVGTPDIPRTPEVAEMISSYFENGWHTRDIRARAGFPLLLSGARVVADDDVVTAEQMRSSSFYNESLYPFGLQWFAAVGFWAGPAFWALSFQRTPQQGPFQLREKRMLAELAQHLTEVATLSSAIGRVALLGGTNALSAVRHPAVAIDHCGSVLEANSAMGTVYDEELRIRNKRLFVADPKASAALDRLIERITASEGGSALACIEPIVIHRRAREPIILRVLTVPPAARNPFLGARAILTFNVVEARPRLDASLLNQVFSLTPAEARLAIALADGSNLEAVSEQLRISRETARNQLKSVFLKTGSHRQSQLVALLARL